MDYRQSYIPDKNDKHVETCVGVALHFLTSQGITSSKDIISKFYSNPELGVRTDEAAKTAFKRDKRELSQIGIHIVQSPGSNQSDLMLDDESTFIDQKRVDTEMLPAIDMALSPVLSDPNFMEREQLAAALVKLSPDFESPRGGVIQATTSANALEKKLRTAFSNRTTIDALYLKADDVAEKRYELMPFGFFAKRGVPYVVCANAQYPDREPHTFCISRFKSVKFGKRKSYEIPPSFSLEEYIRLPFQIGECTAKASFYIPSNKASLMEREFENSGFVETREDGSLLVSNVDVASVPLAASWAYANEIIPLEPQELVDEHKTAFSPTR